MGVGYFVSAGATMTTNAAANAARRVAALEAEIERLLARQRQATTESRKQRFASAIRRCQAEIQSLT